MGVGRAGRIKILTSDASKLPNIDGARKTEQSWPQEVRTFLVHVRGAGKEITTVLRYKSILQASYDFSLLDDDAPDCLELMSAPRSM